MGNMHAYENVGIKYVPPAHLLGRVEPLTDALIEHFTSVEDQRFMARYLDREFLAVAPGIPTNIAVGVAKILDSRPSPPLNLRTHRSVSKGSLTKRTQNQANAINGLSSKHKVPKNVLKVGISVLFDAFTRVSRQCIMVTFYTSSEAADAHLLEVKDVCMAGYRYFRARGHTALFWVLGPKKFVEQVTRVF
jgi:hypothetical protein